MIELNLLPPQNVLTQREAQLRKDITLYVASIGILIVIFQVFLTLSGALIGFQSSIQNKKKADLLEILKTNNEAAVDLRTVQDKIKGIKQINQRRVDFGKIYGDILSLTLPNAQIKSLVVDSTGTTFLSLTSPNLLVFGNFMDKVTSDSQPVPFSQILLSGVREMSGTLNYSLNMKYKFGN